MVVFRQSGCIRTKVVVFGKKWFYSGKSGCIRVKVDVVVQRCCNQAKVVVFGKSRCIWAKVFLLGQEWLY